MARGCACSMRNWVVDCNDRDRRLSAFRRHIAKPGARHAGPGTYSVNDGQAPGLTVDSIMAIAWRFSHDAKPASLRNEGRRRTRRSEKTRLSADDDGGWVATYDDITEREKKTPKSVWRSKNERFDPP